jgi:isopenicillin-N epimerase
MSNHLRDHFLLDPDVIFLNHGSFGACPRPVFETYQNWQLELERQPVEFLGRRHDALLDEARASLSQYVNADIDNLVFVPNATAGVNVVARSLSLQPGDEILTTDHEYGAINKTWEFVCQQTGACYVQHPIELPVSSPEAFVESFWSAVTPQTRVISISHITSPTALIFPIEEICRRAREAGILTIIDGAHAPGQIPVDLRAIDADFYSGNCHKWLSAPKGAAFLYARPEHHLMMQPSIISWGWSNEASFVSRIQAQGTRDLAAFLSVPAAIEFQAEHDWDAVRRDCHALAVGLVERMTALTGLPPIAPENWFNQMVALPLPPHDTDDLKRRLYDNYRIEVPLGTWNERQFTRVSIQGYNTQSDLDALVNALADLLSV